MQKERNVDQRILDRMGRYYPFILSDAIEINQIGPMELLIKMSDSSVVLYDDVDQTFRKLPQDRDHMTEQQCRHELGMRLKRLMYRRGVTQKQLAEKTGISEIAISNYINEKQTPSFYNVDRIAKVLQCSIDDLRYY